MKDLKFSKHLSFALINCFIEAVLELCEIPCFFRMSILYTHMSA